MSGLSVENLSFSYGRTAILSRASCRVAPGEVAVLLGPNGAGKSTFLRCVDRVLKPSGGRVTVGGRDVSAMTPRERARLMGYVPQVTLPGDGSITVYDAILLGRRPYIGWDATERDRAAAREAADRLGLSSLLMRPVGELSGGERQKVAVARAVAGEPEVLLLDEPTASLDLKNQLETVAYLRALTAERQTATLVTIHDVNLALRLGDRLLYLNGGTVVDVGRPADLTPELIETIYGISAAVIHRDGVTAVIPDIL